MSKTSLVSYSGSSSEEENTDCPPPKKKKVEQKAVQDRECSKKQSKLPVPGEIKDLFKEENNLKNDLYNDHSQHGGRIRSFAHEEGNWATLVCIPFDPDERFLNLQKELFTCLYPVEFQPMNDYHISLSRTVTIRHHWIQPLVNSLKRGFDLCESCACEIQTVKLFTNDEKTRTFLTLEIVPATDSLQQYVKVVDECFKEYALPSYYKTPSFHVSIGWVLGDLVDEISQKVKDSLLEKLEKNLSLSPELKYFDVEEIHCRTGNKLFKFYLTDT